MRVVFLDFDGVLNHPGVYAEVERRRGLGPENLAKFTEAEWLDPALVRRVGELALRAGAIVAVLSTWRQRFRRTQLCEILRSRGLPDGVPVDACERGCTKEEAVRRYLDRWDGTSREIESYVVLDDSGLAMDPRRLVRTDGAVGVTERDIVAAEAILRVPL